MDKRERDRLKAKRYRDRHKNDPEYLARKLAYDRQWRDAHRAELKEVYRRSRQKHPLRNVWIGMMRRCGLFKYEDEEHLRFYRDKGITVCQEWRKFAPFEKWATEHGYAKGLEIDRIDGSKDYSPDNCRWVTRVQNCRNRKSTLMVKYHGKLMPLIEVWEAAPVHPENVNYMAFRARVQTGWSIEEALTRKGKNCHAKSHSCA